MNNKEMKEFVDKCKTLGSVMGLDSIKCLLNKLGNPQNNLLVIHIAGTNGKGSVGNFLANILAEAGYIVGRYISPTVFSDDEKIQKISKEKVTYILPEEQRDVFRKLKNVCEEMEAEGKMHPTLFEVETAAAFLQFEKWNVDYVILEVGMGGEHDATNVLQSPLCTVFTSISLDHTNILGSTLQEIAKEKAGIMKNDSICITAKQEEVVMDVLKKEAKEKVCELFCVKDVKAKVLEKAFTYSVFSKEEEFVLSQAGVYQIDNAALAVETILNLVKKDLVECPIQAIKEGLKKSIWKGRFHLVSQNPLCIVDGAHNPDGVKSLCKSISQYYPDNPIQIIMGVFKDKQYEEMLEVLRSISKDIYTIDTTPERGLPKEILAEYAKKEGFIIRGSGLVKSMLSEAMERATKESEKQWVTIVCGSLSIMKEVYAYFEQ